MTTSGVYRNAVGPVFRAKNGSTLNLNGITQISSGVGFPAISVEDGSLLNIIDSGKVTSSDSPTIYVKNSRVNIANVAQISSRNSNALHLETFDSGTSSVIVSRLDLLSGSVPVLMLGTCHVNLNRITTFSTTGDDSTAIRGTNTSKGSLIVQNTGRIDGSIQTLDMDVTLRNVQSVSTSGESATIVFNSSSDGAKGSYKLKIDGKTYLEGTEALSLTNSAAELTGVTLAGDSTITDSVVTITNSYVNNPLVVTDSTLIGTRTTFSSITPSTSHITTYNCSITDLSPSSSSVVTHHSLITGTIDSSNRSAVWLHNSKAIGTVSLATGSALTGSASDISGNVTANASFFGSYGGTYGTVTTAGKGLALAFGSSTGTIDGRASNANVLSAMTDTLNIYADKLMLESVKNTELNIGQNFLIDVTGNFTMEIGGTYSNTVTGTYNDDITGAVLIKAGSTYTVTASGAVNISGNPTVTI